MNDALYLRIACPDSAAAYKYDGVIVACVRVFKICVGFNLLAVTSQHRLRRIGSDGDGGTQFLQDRAWQPVLYL